jgi:hypothetical protein
MTQKVFHCEKALAVLRRALFSMQIGASRPRSPMASGALRRGGALRAIYSAESSLFWLCAQRCEITHALVDEKWMLIYS